MISSDYTGIVNSIEVTSFLNSKDVYGVQWSLSYLIGLISKDTINSRRVASARSEYAVSGNSGEYKSLKRGLRMISWNVSKFKGRVRGKRNVSKMSGLMYFDVDGGKTKADVLASPIAAHVVAMWSSVSGNGVGGLIWAPGVSESNFENYWNAMLELSGGIIDKKCKDVARCNFLSFDMEPWLATGVVLGFEPSTPVAEVKEDIENKSPLLSAYAPATTPRNFSRRKPSISERVVPLTPGVPHATPVCTYPANRSFFFSFRIKMTIDEGTAPIRILEDTENKSPLLSAYAPATTPRNFSRPIPDHEIERASTFMPKFVSKGSRTTYLSLFFRNYFIARPESFSLRTMIKMVSKMWNRFDGDIAYSDLKSIHAELADEAASLGGLRPYSSKTKLPFDGKSTVRERQSLGGRHSGRAKRDASEQSILDFIRSYSGSAKLTSSVIGAGIGVNPSTVRRHMTGRVGSELREKNEELNLIKTKRKRTGSFKEPEAKSDAKHQLEYESSPRVAGYAQEDNNACVEEPEFKYCFSDTLKLNIVAE